jgi:dihydroxyacetone kinase-like protein
MSITREQVLAWLENCAAVLSENRQFLIDLDAAIGDADHGENMHRGFQAVLAKLPEISSKDIGAILKAVGMTLISTVGGAGGPLYGTFFLQAGGPLAGKLAMGLEDWCAALDAGVRGVILRGKAEPGEKTMVDALLPAVERMRAALQDPVSQVEALHASAEAARQGMLATIPMLARKGRSSYLGERSIGHQDPGATSAYLLLKTAADTWTGA